MTALSPRLAAIVDALPLKPGLRVLEIGCGPGAAAREVVRRLGADGFVLGIDRSAKAIGQAEALSREEMSIGRLAFRQVAAEDFTLQPGDPPFDLIFAVRVGGLDGRHPDLADHILRRLAEASSAKARLFIDGGAPLRELRLPH